MTARAARGIGLPRPAIVWAIAAAWLLAIAAHTRGASHLVHHDRIFGAGGPPEVVALFGAVWVAHVGAMMLPSSLPLWTLFSRAAAGQERPGAARLAFLGGYLAVWTAFGFVLLAGDLLVHSAASGWAWLDSHPQVIAGTVLVGAGAFQFSGLKDRCLTVCRLPAAFLRRHYRRGVGAAIRMGSGHGLYCLGCCWALMLVMFAAGLANLVWMAPLVLLMVVEKVSPGGHRIVFPAGVVLIAAGLVVLARPGWLLFGVA